MSIAIVVMSCDKNKDLWLPFHLCVEKYWKDHPPIFYSSETLTNPYYETFCNDLPIEKWTKRVWDIASKLEYDKILLMVDDLFIREEVNNFLIERLGDNVGSVIGALNFEKSFDPQDIPLNDMISIRNPKGKWKTSVMCQLWNKKAMLDIFDCEMTPWDFESKNDSKDYIFLISNKGNFLNWGYGERKWFGIRKGKWCKEVKEFFDKENIEIDYSIRGFYE